MADGCLRVCGGLGGRIEVSEERLQAIRNMAAEYAKAKAQRVYLEHFRKSKRAMLMKQAELDGEKTAVAQEREAYADREYVELLEGLKEATEIEARLYWELRVTEMRFEAWRTKQANERAEKGRYGA